MSGTVVEDYSWSMERSTELVNAPRHIAVLIETSSSWGSGLVEGIAEYSQRHGPWVLYLEPHGKYESLTLPHPWAGEGVIARVTTQTLADQIVELGLPAVNVSWYRYGENQITRCTADENQAGELAAQHFLDRGFRHFGYCDSPHRPSNADHLGAAFATALKARGFSCTVYKAHCRSSSPWHEQLDDLGNWLERQPKPLALLTFDSVVGRRVTEICSVRHLRVPDEVAVLAGEHDRLSSEISSPPLSGIDLSARRVGYEAAHVLHGLMEGHRPPAHPVLVPVTTVVTRTSTDMLAIEDEFLAEAVRFIRSAAHRPIGVADVLRRVPLSRRVLEQKFRRLLGRSPGAEIRRVKIERAKQLLADTDWLMPRIAHQCGFERAEVLSRAFRREVGVSPSVFRKRARH